MRLILQRVERAAVWVAGEAAGVDDEDGWASPQLVGEIGHGALVLAGIEAGDGAAEVAAAADKLAGLRMFQDDAGKLNLAAGPAGAAFLVVSQFTLAADLSKGRRPSFNTAARPAVAEPLVDALVADLRRRGFQVETGRFGAAMKVDLVNDGPVTFVLDV